MKHKATLPGLARTRSGAAVKGGRCLVSACAVLLSAISAMSADAPMDWSACVKEAVTNHPDLILAREKVCAAKVNRAIARSGALPQVEADLGGSRSDRSGQDANESYSYGVRARQLVFDSFKTRRGIEEAEERIAASQFGYETASSDVRLALRTAFVRMLRAQELLGIAEGILKRREQSLKLIELRYEAGREHRGSLLTARARQAQAEFEVAQARRNIELAQRSMTKELGRAGFSPIEAAGSLDVPPTEKAKPDFDRLAENSPVVKELASAARAAQLSLASARADLYPKVYASANAGRDGTSWPPDQSDWSVGGSLSVSLYEGGRSVGEVDRARTAWRQTRENERNGRLSVSALLQSRWTEAQDAMGMVDVQRKFLDAAEERAKIAEAQYSSGHIAFDNWIIIEDDFVSVQKAMLSARANAVTAAANWDHSLGRTLENE